MKTRNCWPLGIALTLVLFLFFTIGLVVFACTQRVDLVKNDYYSDELKFQEHIDSRNRASTTTAKTEVIYDANSKQIKISFSADQTSSLAGGHIEFYRPDAAELDKSLELKPRADGLQAIDAANFRAGLWRVKLYWNAGGKDYFTEQQIVIKHE